MALYVTPPRHRIILAVDMAGSAIRTNSVKASFRRVMYTIVEKCLVTSGVRKEYRDPFIDRGDGILALIHPVDEVPKTVLLSKTVPTLDALLRQYGNVCPGQQLRLRVVVHAGEVLYDDCGCFGESLDVAFRLLDHVEVKERFRLTQAPLLLVVSDDIHQSVVRHGYDGIDQHAFIPAVHVVVADRIHLGWVSMPVPGRLLTAGPVDD
ncbi:hypothetical protein [Actinocrispum wychmicini]|uniref:Uncharacterized protein n=1 Tax=Actinocrispum wychmicini TaxID=1213861 RepID=A0A4V2S768_9PSEU|nr:hypothetical protein [Actinocrispum wychmicini]TCO58730.1 hypothetical protein EV192_105802 [Actinocrispum wychmicini]